jgi:beta-lactamase class A
MKAKIIKYSIIGLLLMPGLLSAQTRLDALKQKINYIIDIDTAGGKIGVGVLGVDYVDFGFLINGDRDYPMQSVFKFPLALAILHMVDEGKLSMDQKFHFAKEKLDTSTWSPMIKDFPNQDIDISLSQLLAYAVTKSDNTACDFLYGVAGGPAAVSTWLHSSGINGISIVYTEGQMAKAWRLQYKNSCRPSAMMQMLQMLYNQSLLSKSSNDFLISIMTEVPGWSQRITALLPPGVKLIHKTGSSGVNAQGMLAATNDVGIVTLPNGKHLAIVVFVSDYKGPRERGEHIIALIAKQVWDYYTSK